MRPLRLAADTNLLLDWADKVESVLDALAVIEERLPQAEQFVTPSTLDELAFLQRDIGGDASGKHAGAEGRGPK